MTAAGRRIEPTDPAEIKDLGKRPFEWQKKAYNFYDPMSPMALGEVWFAARYVSESLSRIRLYPAVQPDPDSDPISILSPALEGADLPPDNEIELLLAATRRLTNSHGGQSDIIRGHALNNFLAGESFLIGRTVEDAEEWEVHSIDALEHDAQGQALGLKIRPDDRADQLVSLEDATVIRIWRRHPRFPELPDAAMGAAAAYCDDLYLFRNMIRAAGRSRIPSGMLLIPSEASEGPLDFTSDEGAEGDEGRDPFTESLIRHMETPLRDPSDAAAIVPFVMRLAGDDLDKVKYESFSRDIDKLAVELRRESREAFAATIDLPADVLTGKQGLNDWSAWNVDEETFRIHLASHIELIVDGLTPGYLWPTIAKGVENPRRYRLWYDARDLIAHPDQASNAVLAHDRIVISDDTLRRSLNFDDDDAPDDEEYARRVEEKKASTRQPGGPENGPPSAQGPTEEAQGQATVESITAGAITAAARIDRQSLGYRLAQIEQRLLDRLLAASDSEMRRALERAGNRIIASARRRSAGEQVREIVRATPTADVAARLGPSLVAALGFTDDDLIDGAFESLRARWDSWTRRAQEQALAAIQEEGDAIDDEDEEALLAQMDDDREAGWLIFAASLATATATQLYSAGQPSALGERDETAVVAPGVLRDALARAGGGPQAGAAAETAVSGNGRGGLLSGETIRVAFRASALRELGWVWLYGDQSTRSMPFEPHANLDGVTFDSWEDADLVNVESFPEVNYFYPGDHFGCQCTFARDGQATVTDETGASEELAA